MASTIYNKPYENCLEFHPETGEKQPEGAKLRGSVKSIVLGLMYGRSTNSVAEQLGVAKEEAQRYTDLVFETFPGIKNLIDVYKKFVSENGYIQTVYGVKRRLPDYLLPEYEFIDSSTKQPIEDDTVVKYYLTRLQNAWGSESNKVKRDAQSKGVKILDNRMKIADAERQILNSVIQGSSANITKKAMLDIFNDKELNDLGFKILLTVHDEVIGEAPKENAKRSAERLCEVMVNSVKDFISVPMSVDAEINERWYGENIDL